MDGKVWGLEVCPVRATPLIGPLWKACLLVFQLQKLNILILGRKPLESVWMGVEESLQKDKVGYSITECSWGGLLYTAVESWESAGNVIPNTTYQPVPAPACCHIIYF